MNSVHLVGNISNDPNWVEDKYCKFNLAVKRKFAKDETDFISCIAFKKTGDFIGRWFAKGSRIAVSGSIRTGSYEKDGKKLYSTDVVVEEADFCERTNPHSNLEKVSAEGFYTDLSDEGLPFD